MKKLLIISSFIILNAVADPVVISTDDVGVLENEEELLSQVFGAKRRSKETLMEFTLLLDGEKVGEAMVLVGKTKKVLAKSIKEVLSDYLLQDEINKIDSKKDNRGFVTFEDLGFLQLDTKFDMAKLELQINVPVHIKKTRSLGSRHGGSKEKINVENAKISGFVNTRFSQTMRNGQDKVDRTAVFTPAINIFGLVLEGECSYNNSNSKNKFHRSYTSVVFDIPDSNITLRAGDIFSNSIDYQSVPKVRGFSIKKNAELSSVENYNEPIQITLLRTSTIEVYVNNVLMKTRNNVAPGTYTLDDVPYSYGTNDVKIRIVDDTGREQYVNSDVFFDSAFVAKGTCGFGATVGQPEINRENARYDVKNPVVSAYLKYGLFHLTELSVGGQGNKIGQSYTFGIKDKSKIGTIDLKYALSRNKDVANKSINGSVIYASYSSPSINISKISSHVGVSIERADDFFYPYLQNAISQENSGAFLNQRSNEKGKRTNIRYHLSFCNVFSTNWSLNYNVRNKTSAERVKSFSINGSKYFTCDNDVFKNGYWNCSFERANSFGKTSRTLSLSVSLSLANSIHVSAGYTDGAHSSYNVSISNQVADNGLSYNASISKCGNYNLFANYNHPAFKTNVNYIRSHYSTNSTQVGIESTLFFADGAFAIARNSVYDGGFIIAKPINDLEKTGIKFTNNQAESNIFGGAVIQTSKNSIGSARLNIEDMPDNMEIKKDTLTFRGEYKRGALAEISCEGSYVAKGILKDDTGDVLSLVSGYAIHKNDSNADPVQFFTNSNGKFIMMGLKPGVYRVTVNLECCSDFDIEVKESKDSVIDLGTIVCKDCEDEEVINI